MNDVNLGPIIFKYALVDDVQPSNVALAFGGCNARISSKFNKSFLLIANSEYVCNPRGWRRILILKMRPKVE